MDRPSQRNHGISRTSDAWRANRALAMSRAMAITAKDISLTVGEAEDLGVPMWVAQSVRQVWKYAVSQGGADRDGTSLVTYLEPWAGIELCPANSSPPTVSPITAAA